ncbi:cation:proton antiporter [Pinisolibacter aquiterrae]|uniref:cation:proton antiporter domain-containing protein n=1 Tax=Pinisolibacter aquiterrae TaxID=2815579 RepID=UPI001E6239B6|nr:cation:proton antiporter [Pinisolibacter aquiterrae]MCC8237376.1 cation:proton antiporter [Pinisolibacter aquiterrae]
MAGAAIELTVMKDALVVLGTAGVVVPLMHRLKVGSVLGFLLAGAVLGPHGLARFADVVPPLGWITIEKRGEIAGIADFGVVFLLFVIGLELSLARLSALKRLVFGLGGLQVVLSAMLLGALALRLGQPPAAALVLGSCLALSSTAVVIEVLAEQKRLASITGRTAFAVLLFQDLAVVPILIMVEQLGGGGSGHSVWLDLGVALSKGVLAVAAIVVIGRLALKPLFRVVAETRSVELFMATILFVAVGTGVVTALVGMSMALGAFVAGLLLAETEYRRAIETMIEPFKGLLLGVFFFSVGMTVDLDFLAAHPILIAAGAVTLVLVKGLVTGLGARVFGIDRAHALKTALLIGPGGEFAFIVVGLAESLKVVDAETATFVVAVVGLSMAAIPFFDTAGKRVSQEIVRRSPPDPVALVTPPEDHAARAVVVGFGRVGRLVADLFDEHRISWIAADLDTANVAEGRRAGRPVYFGDVTNPLFLRSCGVADAEAVVVTVDSPTAVDSIVDAVRAERPTVPLVVRARDAGHARRLYKKGVTDAVPETIEASLQLSEAALVGLGIAMGPIIASIHEKRDVFRRELSEAAEASTQASPLARKPALRTRRRDPA